MRMSTCARVCASVCGCVSARVNECARARVCVSHMYLNSITEVY